MTSLEKQLQNARPRLRVVSPLGHWILVILATFNVIFGITLFLALDADRFSAPLIIVNDLFSYDFWGIVFIVLGLLKFYSIYSNRWNLARHTLITGVSIKATWAIALTIRSLVSPGTLLVNLIWVTLAAIQMCTYIFFMPPSVDNYKQRREDR